MKRNLWQSSQIRKPMKKKKKNLFKSTMSSSSPCSNRPFVFESQLKSQLKLMKRKAFGLVLLPSPPLSLSKSKSFFSRGRSFRFFPVSSTEFWCLIRTFNMHRLILIPFNFLILLFNFILFFIFFLLFCVLEQV